MLTEYVHILSLLLWIGVIVTVTSGVVAALWRLVKTGEAGTAYARRRVASGIVSGLGLTTAIALLSTTQLRTWNAIGLFAAAAALRTFVKYAERHIS